MTIGEGTAGCALSEVAPCATAGNAAFLAVREPSARGASFDDPKKERMPR